jgi:cell division protease FtsH
MVCEWGMSDKLGPLQYGQKEEPIFIGKEIARHKDYSERTSQSIDEEIKRIVEEAREKATDILTKNKVTLDKLAKRLLEKEVLDRKEIEEVVGVKKAAAKKKKPIPADSTETPVREKSTEKKKAPLDKLKLATNDAGAE